MHNLPSYNQLMGGVLSVILYGTTETAHREGQAPGVTPCRDPRSRPPAADTHTGNPGCTAIAAGLLLRFKSVSQSAIAAGLLLKLKVMQPKRRQAPTPTRPDRERNTLHSTTPGIQAPAAARGPALLHPNSNVRVLLRPDFNLRPLLRPNSNM